MVRHTQTALVVDQATASIIDYESFCMAYEYINEPVEIRVDFCGRRVVPRVMNWNNRLYTILNVNMVHHDSQGTAQQYFFSVSDMHNYFKLQFNAENLEWRLLEMYEG